jgi:transcription elongation factor GreA
VFDRGSTRTKVNNKPEYLSAEGLERLRAELAELTHVKRPEVAQRIHDAKEHGDVTENAEYEDAKNEQAFIEGRIQALEAVIKNAVLIDENHSRTHVQIGSTVTIEGDNGKEKYTIVGSVEAAPVGAGRGLHVHDRQHPLTGRRRPRPCGAATRKKGRRADDVLG